MKKIFNFICLASVFICFTFNGIGQDLKGSKPNIVIILFDDLGYGDWGSFGNPTIKTPNLDQLCEEGMKFTQFYTGACVCSPSRAALLTGRLPVRMGMLSTKERVFFPNSTGGLPLDDSTIAEELKMVGYTTGCIGKWHLGDHSPYLPTDRGFDYYYGIPYSNDMGASPKNVYPPLPILRNKKIVEQPVDQKTLTKKYTKEALSFIDRNKDTPFFLYYATNFPHVPLYASKGFRDTSTRGLYGDVIEELDWSVGQVIKKLKETGLDKNTLVFVTSDNGPWLSRGTNGGSAGLLRAGKGTTWEGGMRVPAVAWWPGVVKNNVNLALATTMDLFTTSLYLAGVKNPSYEIDGQNIIDILKGRKEGADRSIWFWRSNKLFAMRKGPWKLEVLTQPGYPYNHFINTGSGVENIFIPTLLVRHDPPLLFNLDKDPSERFNVAKDHPKLVKRLLKEFKEHKRSIDIESLKDQMAERIDRSTLLMTPKQIEKYRHKKNRN